MTLQSEGVPSNWQPQWKELKANNGFLYAARADGLLWPKGILVKPVVGKDKINPDNIFQALLLGYFQEPGGVPEPKVASIVNKDGSVLVDYSPLSTFQKSIEISPYNIHATAAKGRFGAEVLLNVSTHFRDQVKFGQQETNDSGPTEIPNISTVKVYRDGAPLVTWGESNRDYDDRSDPLNRHIIHINQGVVKGIEDQAVGVHVTDLEGSDLINLGVNEDGAINLTQYDYESDKKGKKILSQIDPNLKLSVESLKTLMVPWDRWLNILAAFEDQKKLDDLLKHAIKLDKRVIKPQQGLAFSET